MFLILLVSAGAALAANDEFPGREKYPEITVISKEDLNSRMKDYVIVDARSAYEFQTLRIKSAINIPVASKNFEQQVKELWKKERREIAFYCNGRTCMKSYLAAKKSIEAGVKKVVAYDAGIFEWVQRYPKQAELLGRSPVNLNQLIAKENFNKRLLDPDTFSEKMANLGGQSIVLDVRDKYQRAGIGFFPGKERWVSLDKAEQLHKYIKKAKEEKKTLLIYDEVGKQVRWLQYSLEKAGISDYFFMKKGATEYYRVLAEMQRQGT